jgi:hypothetical protein
MLNRIITTITIDAAIIEFLTALSEDSSIGEFIHALWAKYNIIPFMVLNFKK